MQTRTVRTTIYLAAGVGLIIAIFSGLEFIDTALQSICSFNGFFSCAAVAQSGKTTLLGIQDYALGIAGFIIILALNGCAERRPDDPRWSYALLGLTTLGVALSFYFLYVELYEIGAFCLVCFSSYVMGFIAWGGAIELARRTRIADAPA
ncbi:MAG: vitamin K epoxide reductase family protein [Thermoplasmata archaeon]|jgi:uncharacterized membrane protein